MVSAHSLLATVISQFNRYFLSNWCLILQNVGEANGSCCQNFWLGMCNLSNVSLITSLVLSPKNAQIVEGRHCYPWKLRAAIFSKWTIEVLENSSELSGFLKLGTWGVWCTEFAVAKFFIHNIYSCLLAFTWLHTDRKARFWAYVCNGLMTFTHNGQIFRASFFSWEKKKKGSGKSLLNAIEICSKRKVRSEPPRRNGLVKVKQNFSHSGGTLK